MRFGEIVAGDRGLDGLAPFEREAQLRGIARDVAWLNRLLIRLVRLMIADDLFDADAALRRDADRFLRDLRLFSVIERQQERAFDRLDADEKVPAFRADIGDLPIASSVYAPRSCVAIAG